MVLELAAVGAPYLIMGGHQVTSGSGNSALPASGSVSPDPTISFLETGLAPGTEWYVTIQTQAQVLSNSGGTTQSSTTDNISFKLGAGSYNANIVAPGPYVSPGTYGINVASKSYTLKAPFTDMFPVTVTGIGAPKNASLGISLNGDLRTNLLNSYGSNGYGSSEHTVTKLAVNGTYRVMFGESLPNGASLFGYVGNVTVNGTGTNLQVDFHQVNLTAVGLPDNVSWGFHGQIDLATGYYPPDQLLPGLARNTTIYLPTGSTFLQPVAKGYYSRGFYVNLTDSNASRVVEFEKEYPVYVNSNFQVFPYGSQWGVTGVPYTFDGSPYFAPYSPSFELYVPNGTYNMSVWVALSTNEVTVNGTYNYLSYTYNMNLSNLTVNGNAQTVHIFFNLSYTPVKNPEANIIPFIIGGIIIVALSIAGTAYYVNKGKRK